MLDKLSRKFGIAIDRTVVAEAVLFVVTFHAAFTALWLVTPQ